MADDVLVSDSVIEYEHWSRKTKRLRPATNLRRRTDRRQDAYGSHNAEPHHLCYPSLHRWEAAGIAKRFITQIRRPVRPQPIVRSHDGIERPWDDVFDGPPDYLTEVLTAHRMIPVHSEPLITGFCPYIARHASTGAWAPSFIGVREPNGVVPRAANCTQRPTLAYASDLDASGRDADGRKVRLSKSDRSMSVDRIRTWLQVTSVCVVRLQSINVDDGLRLGLGDSLADSSTERGLPSILQRFRAAYAVHWDHLVGTANDHPEMMTHEQDRYPYSWDDNPWVWAINVRITSRPSSVPPHMDPVKYP